jgi:hypothetical protein
MSATIIPFLLRGPRRIPAQARPVLAECSGMNAAEMRAIIAAGATVEMLLAAKEAEEEAERIRDAAASEERRRKERDRKKDWRRRKHNNVPQCPKGHAGPPADGTPLKRGFPSTPKRTRPPTANAGGRGRGATGRKQSSPSDPVEWIEGQHPWWQALVDRAVLEGRPRLDPRWSKHQPPGTASGEFFPKAWVDELRQKRAVA